MLQIHKSMRGECLVINMKKIKKICALILLAVSIFLIGACCSLSVQAKESDAYDRIESGDWSDVKNFDESQALVITKKVNWVRKDLNYDEIPELLCLSVSGAVGNRMPIQFIFTYSNNQVEIVFSNPENDSEYYYLGENGNLLCDCGSYAVGKYHSVSMYQFDADWKLKKKKRLEVSCEEGGNKISCFEEEPLIADALSENGDGEEWNVIPISGEKFLEEYQRMTGEDFFEKGSDWKQLFKNAGNSADGIGFTYGKWEPSLTENEFVKAVKNCEAFKGRETLRENCDSLTYAGDFDGDETIEAFVVMGKDAYGKEINRFEGESLWFVNSQHKAVMLMESLPDTARVQEYLKKDNNIYFFLLITDMHL